MREFDAMSKYAFAIKNAAGLLEKAKYDSDRFNNRRHDEITWSYALIDYMQTIWHLADWLSKELDVPLNQVRDDIDAMCDGMYKLAGDLACGQKHWERDGKSNPPQIVAKASAPALRSRPSLMGLSMRRREPPFVIDNNGKKTYAQIILRDTLAAVESYMKDQGIIQ